jgi:adenylosuccinate lyase
MEELPFVATENILMSATKAGGDRQDLHEKIRAHAQGAAKKMKATGEPNDLLARLKADPAFSRADLGSALEPSQYVGLAPLQTENYVKKVVEPALKPYKKELGEKADFNL